MNRLCNIQKKYQIFKVHKDLRKCHARNMIQII